MSELKIYKLLLADKGLDSDTFLGRVGQLYDDFQDIVVPFAKEYGRACYADHELAVELNDEEYLHLRLILPAMYDLMCMGKND